MYVVWCGCELQIRKHVSRLKLSSDFPYFTRVSGLLFLSMGKLWEKLSDKMYLFDLAVVLFLFALRNVQVDSLGHFR